jgi:hypothetical protein
MKSLNPTFYLRVFAVALMAFLAVKGWLPADAAMGLAMAGTLTGDTLSLMKGSLAKSDDSISKSVSTATGLVAYDLQAPSKNLYPVNTPLRNKIPRVGGGVGTATNWKAVKAILGSGFDAMGWVPEGQRTGRMNYTVANVTASYMTIGEEDQVTFEGINAARTFEDIRSTASMRVLQKMMLKEENAILLGNQSVNLGTPVTPTVSAAGTGGTLPTLTYSVIVVALTGEGVRGASVVNGIPLSSTLTGADGQTYTLNGGSSIKSAAGAAAVTLGQVLNVSTTAINGAMGYAWFVGPAGTERLQSITPINSAKFSTPISATTQLASAVTSGDKSSNSIAFDGLIYSALKPGSGAYVNILPTGVPGVGSVLTASGKGTVVEIDDMLRSMWDQYQVSPTVIYVNAQELNNITTKALTGPSSAPLLQMFTDPSSGYQGMMAGGVVGFYFNPFAMDGGIKIPIKIHPTLPAGTLIGWAENLPTQYQSNNVPNVAEVKLRQDYYQIDWPLRTRAQEFGVYCEEVLAVYAPFALGIITNIANG